MQRPSPTRTWGRRAGNAGRRCRWRARRPARTHPLCKPARWDRGRRRPRRISRARSSRGRQSVRCMRSSRRLTRRLSSRLGLRRNPKHRRKRRLARPRAHGPSAHSGRLRQHLRSARARRRSARGPHSVKPRTPRSRVYFQRLPGDWAARQAPQPALAGWIHRSVEYRFEQGQTIGVAQRLQVKSNRPAAPQHR